MEIILEPRKNIKIKKVCLRTFYIAGQTL